MNEQRTIKTVDGATKRMPTATDTMLCALLVRPGELVLSRVEKPKPSADEVLIKVELAAICGSDAALYHGKFAVALPLIPGHEAVGRVAARGSAVAGLHLGQRVVLQPNYGCRICPVCCRGLANVCPEKIRIGLDVNGVFGEYVTVPGHCVWPIPDSLDNETAVFTEPAAVAYHGFVKARPEGGQRVLVLGAGVIGLLMIQLAAGSGAVVTAMDLVAQRLVLAKRLGAVAGCTTPEQAGGQGPFDVIFDTSGAPGALDCAIALAAPGARIVVLGLAAAAHPVSSSTIVRKELQILGSMIYTDEFPKVMEMLAEGAIETRLLVSSTHELAELAQALENFSSPERVKTLIRMVPN